MVKKKNLIRRILDTNTLRSLNSKAVLILYCPFNICNCLKRKSSKNKSKSNYSCKSTVGDNQKSLHSFIFLLNRLYGNDTTNSSAKKRKIYLKC